MGRERILEVRTFELVTLGNGVSGLLGSVGSSKTNRAGNDEENDAVAVDVAVGIIQLPLMIFRWWEVQGDDVKGQKKMWLGYVVPLGEHFPLATYTKR